MHYFWQRVRPRGLGRGCLYSRAAEKGYSRKLSFRCTEFSETQSVPLLILKNPICRGNPIRSGLGLCTNSRTTFRSMEFSETELPINSILGTHPLSQENSTFDLRRCHRQPGPWPGTL